MSICRAKLSQVMNGCGAYGTGAASTAHIERDYRRTFEKMECPHSEQSVSISICRENALSAAPTHNPRQMMQWQACQQCVHKPKPLTEAAPVPKKRALNRTTEAVPVQQAGIIDKVTLPLPIVGAPQIQNYQEPT
ncbi:MarR family transcriptional regulator [Undibacterium sp. SXout11W]|uniref:MarR family transcriptional regulator n=1 Tax=Undibacterium sp. SXout11W TaxID=3413050 RepID=UPI003BF0D528